MPIPTGQLPLEDAHHEWNAGLEPDFAKARAPFDMLRDFAVADNAALTATKPADHATLVVLMAQVAKVLKAYRGMLMLCEAGHGHEALVLLRVVPETSAQILWICRNANPPHAARQALAYQDKRLAIVLEEAGLHADAAQARANMDASLALIPGVTSQTIAKHWSGLPGFQHLCTQLGWETHYTLIFRSASAAAHSSDASDHITVDANGHMVLALAAGDKFVRECLAGASVVLDEVNHELRAFGFAI